MKKICRISAAALLVLCLCLSGVAVRADNEPWSEEYYRANDFSHELTDEQQDDLDRKCLDFVREFELDIALLATTDADIGDEQLPDYARRHYEAAKFGYGAGHDGFYWVYNTDQDKVDVFCFGAAEGRVDREYLDSLAEKAAARRADKGVFGVLYGCVGYLTDYLRDHPAEQSGQTARVPEIGETVAVTTGAGRPSWYPADPSAFRDFHTDDATPRVVDRADIFTDEEERGMEARLREIRAEIDRDIVVYTDTTDYGLGQMACADDFFDYNGYGCGDEFEGMCLFIDMDPDERGWWTSCTGSVTMGLYTQTFADLIDDALYEYLAAGRYGDGVADWIENVRSLYVKGSPFAPDWYPEPDGTVKHYDGVAPRVVDDAGALSEPEIAELTARAQEIADKYGFDVAIHIAPTPLGIDSAEYGRAYYDYMGYGSGAERDGILLTVFRRSGYYVNTDIEARGKGAEKLSETNEDRMRSFCEDECDDGAFYEAVSRWLEQLDHMARTGRVPRSTSYWVVMAAVGAVFGAVFGGISLGAARAKMAAPKEKRDADAYVDFRNSQIRNAGEHFLYTTTTRQYSPRETKSSGGGGGGRSSYSSHHTSSSGRSHSGSGRRF